MKHILYLCILFLIVVVSCDSATTPDSNEKKEYKTINITAKNLSFTSFWSDSSSDHPYKDTILDSRLVNSEIERQINDSSSSFQYSNDDSLFFTLVNNEVYGAPTISQTKKYSSTRIILSNNDAFCTVNIMDSLHTETVNELGDFFEMHEKLSLSFVSSKIFISGDSILVSFDKSNIIPSSLQGFYSLHNYQKRPSRNEYFFHRDTSLSINELPNDFILSINLKN